MNNDATSRNQLHLSLDSFSLPSTSPMGVVFGEKVVLEDFEKRTYRQPTQRRGHGMRIGLVEDDDLTAFQRMHVSAPKSII